MNNMEEEEKARFEIIDAIVKTIRTDLRSIVANKKYSKPFDIAMLESIMDSIGTVADGMAMDKEQVKVLEAMFTAE